MAAARKMRKFVSRICNVCLHPDHDSKLQCRERAAFGFKLLEQNQYTRFVKRKIVLCSSCGHLNMRNFRDWLFVRENYKLK